MSLLSCALFVGLLCVTSATPVDDDVIPLPDFGPVTWATEPSSKTGDMVAMWNPSMKTNPEELGDYLEGDMMVKSSMTKTGVVATATNRWPGAVVPYVIVGGFTAAQRNLIFSAMNAIRATTCVRFVPRTNQADYIRITSAASGCWSYVGRIRGAQDVNLQAPGCVSVVGTGIHEFLHALGFIHEQSSPERDSYVIINLQNVQPGTEGNFAKYTWAQATTFNILYDYGSVMHYGAYAFSKNNLPTIVPRQAGVTIGQRNGLSARDIMNIRAMYRC